MKISIETIDGNWPIWAQKIIADRVDDEEPYLVGMLAVGILDALAAGEPENQPTPYDIEIPDFINRHGNW